MKQVSTIKNSLVSTLSHYCFLLLGLIAMLASSCQKDHIHVKKIVAFKAALTTTSTTLQNKNVMKETVPGYIQLILSETNNETKGRFTNPTGTFLVTSNGNITFRKTGTHIETISY